MKEKAFIITAYLIGIAAVFYGIINEIAFNTVIFHAAVFCSGMLRADVNLYDRRKTAASHYSPWKLEAEYPPSNHELAAYLDWQSATLRLPG